ncbi:unnamed protein product [Choristocarpus tenellus]
MAAGHMAVVQGLTLSSDQRLILYSLFKQATEGDCNECKPGLIDLVGRAKWNAWKNREGMASIEAMREYILIVSDICPTWLTDYRQPHGPDTLDQEALNKDLEWEGDDEDEKKGAGLDFGVTVSTLAAGQGDMLEWGAGEEIFQAASQGSALQVQELVQGGVEVNIQVVLVV